MTSAKAKSNRANAQASTGPKTVRGKARAARNARRHGLSGPIVLDQALSEHVQSLAQKILDESNDPEQLSLARGIAEAEIDLARIRRANHELFARNIDSLSFGPAATQDARPKSPQEIVAARANLTRQLTLMVRYEERAQTRYELALRAFDLAAQRALEPSK